MSIQNEADLDWKYATGVLFPYIARLWEITEGIFDSDKLKIIKYTNYLMQKVVRNKYIRFNINRINYWSLRMVSN